MNQPKDIRYEVASQEDINIKTMRKPYQAPPWRTGHDRITPMKRTKHQRWKQARRTGNLKKIKALS